MLDYSLPWLPTAEASTSSVDWIASYKFNWNKNIKYRLYLCINKKDWNIYRTFTIFTKSSGQTSETSESLSFSVSMILDLLLKFLLTIWKKQWKILRPTTYNGVRTSEYVDTEIIIGKPRVACYQHGDIEPLTLFTPIQRK